MCARALDALSYCLKCSLVKVVSRASLQALSALEGHICTLLSHMQGGSEVARSPRGAQRLASLPPLSSPSRAPPPTRHADSVSCLTLAHHAEGIRPRPGVERLAVPKVALAEAALTDSTLGL